MKDAEDEAFDELAKRQGGGYQAKRRMAADKLQEPVPLYVSKPALESWRGFASDYERGFIDGMQKQAQSSVDKAVNQMAQPAQELVARITSDGEEFCIRFSRQQMMRLLAGALFIPPHHSARG